MNLFSSFISHHSSLQRVKLFTLIELLVVVAIIAILAGLMLPALSVSRATARAILCQSNMKQLSMVYLFYSHDYHEYLPCLNNLTPGSKNSYGQTISAKNWLDDLVRQYLSRQQASVNPAKVLRCPDENQNEDITTNYGLNYLLATNETSGIKVSAHLKPAKTGMLIENYGHLCYYCYTRNTTGKHASGSGYGTNRAAFFRHKKTLCVTGFLDGHSVQLDRKHLPCLESYPDTEEAVLKNTFFNSGRVSASEQTVQDL